MGLKLANTNIGTIKLGSTNVSKIYQGSTVIFTAGGGVDPDAQAFITAAEITNATEQSAINTLVVSLKTDGLWNKMQILYPFVGGTALSNKFNLKNPLDTNAAYRLSLVGTFTYSNLGLQIGAASYGIPNWIPNQQSFTNGVHFSTFKNVAGTEYDMGVSAPQGDWALINRFFNNLDYWRAGGSEDYLTATSTTSIGFNAGSTGNNSRSLYENGTRTATGVGAQIGSGVTLPIGFAAVNNNGTYQGINAGARYTFASIGQHLTQAEMLTFYNTLTTFNNTLGR